MKNKLKNYLKFGIFLFGITFVLVNCERDYFEEVQIESAPKLTVKIIDLSDIESNEKVFSKIKKVIKPKNMYKSSSRDTIVNNEYGFIIDTDYVKYVENGNYNSYNFEIIRDNPEDDKLENLFLTLNEDEEYDAFIVKYDFSAEDLRNLNQDELNNGATQYTAIDFDSSFLDKGIALRDALECESEWVFDGCTASPRGPDYTICYWVQEITCTGGGGPGPGPNQDGTGTSDVTTGGNQGSGSSGTTTTTTTNSPYSAPTCTDCPEIVDGPCNSIKNKIREPLFMEKLNQLRDSTNLTYETGFKEVGDGTFPELQAQGSSSLVISGLINMKGYMHTHTDDFLSENDEDGDGELDVNMFIRMPSPKDIKNFLTISYFSTLSNNTWSQADVYGVMVSSDGDYMLKFTGNTDDIPNNTTLMNLTERQKEKLDRKYAKKMDKPNIAKRERNFLKFIKDKIGIDGIRLYKLNNDGSIVEKTLNENNNLVNTPCE